MKLVLLSVLLVAVAVLLLGVRVFFVKGGRFPSTHVHDNPALRRKGISCASGAHHASRRDAASEK
ncbi:MAG: hypothetical protein K2M04_08820 [Muribaculaceae bacterium]|nr:hypothetical protein [Muribaculaceae bacterium]